MKQIIKILLFSSFYFFAINTFADGNPKKLNPNEWIKIEISKTLTKQLFELSESEQLEQLRDWVVSSFVRHLDLNKDENFKILYDFSAIRYDYLNELSNYKYGESRSLILPNRDLVIFIPKNSKKRKVYIAQATDEYRQVYGKQPLKAQIVEYIINNDINPSASFSYINDISKKELFSANYGYYEATILNTNQLDNFLKKIDDIVYVKIINKKIFLGGRQFPDFRTKSINIEDIATLYQADSRIEEEYREKLGNRGLQDEYEDYIQEWANKNYMYMISNNLTRKELKKILREKEPYDNYFSENVNNYVKNVDLNIGFSLDWNTKYKKFSSDLTQILRNDTLFLKNWFNSFISPGLKKGYIFEQKISNENSNNDLTKLFNFGNGEKSLMTFLYGDTAFYENNKILNDSTIIAESLKSSEISEYKLDSMANSYYNEMREVIINNDKVLKLIAQKTKTNDFTLYNKLQLYLQGYMDIDIRNGQSIKKTSQANADILNDMYLYNPLTQKYEERKQKSNNNTIVEEIVLRDFFTIVGILDDELQNKTVFDDDIEKFIRNYQHSKNIRETGIVNNETFKELIKSADFYSYFSYDIKSISRKHYILSRFLRKLKNSNSYQRARYDGYLQGTEVGMTLFYTDLVMKLWSFNYKHSSPDKNILGFISETNNPLSYTYYPEADSLPSTRSWLGDLEEGYQFSNNELCFSHVATKIFNAGSSDLFPGVEVTANTSSTKFANWWNKNYSLVADYEQEFHRLNQIMKWSIIVYWFKQKKLLTSLNKTPVHHSKEFNIWYKTHNNELKTNVDIPFLNRHSLNEKTECMDLLYSEPFIGFLNEYDNDYLIYSFTGGVSLGSKKKVLELSKIKRNNSVLNSGFARSGINYGNKTNLSEFSLFNGSQIKLNNYTKSVNISKMNAKFRASSSELFDISINRKITKSRDILSISENTNKASIGTFTISKDKGVIKLDYLNGDINTTKKLLQNISNNPNKINSEIFQSSDISHSFKVSNSETYYVQLKESKKWIAIESTKKPKINADIRVANGTESHQSATFISENNILSTSENSKWIKLNQNYKGEFITELTNEIPLTKSNKINVWNKGKSQEILIIDNSIYVKNSKNSFYDNLDIVSIIKRNSGTDNFKFFTQKLLNKNESNFFILEGNDIIGFSKKPINQSNITDFKSHIPSNSKIKGLVLSKESEIKLLPNNVLQLPRKMTERDLSVYDFVNTKINENENWINVFKNAEKIEIKDIEYLKKINDDNFHIAESYYKFKSSNLPEGYAIVDMRIEKSNPCITLMTKEGNPQIIKLSSKYEVNVKEISNKLNEFYLGESNLSYNDILELTKPIAEIQKEIIKATNARTFVTVDNGISSEIISKLHGIKGNWHTDNPNINRSIKNAKSNYYLDFDYSIFATTVPLKDNNLNTITNSFLEISNIGFKNYTNLSSYEFKKIINSYTGDFTLMIRVNKNKVVFSDRQVELIELKKWLDYMPELNDAILNGKGKHRNIYIVSNESEILQKIFSESQRFNLIITSKYKIGSVNSLDFALKNISDFYQQFTNKSVIKNRIYKKMLKSNPNLNDLLANKIKKENRTVIIELGKLNENQKNTLKNKMPNIFSKIKKYFTGDGKYEEKTIKSILNESQMKNIEKLRNQKVKPSMNLDFLKAIPNYKVQIDNHEFNRLLNVG